MLLQNPLMCYNKPHLMSQVKRHFLFCIQFLMRRVRNGKLGKTAHNCINSASRSFCWGWHPLLLPSGNLMTCLYGLRYPLFHCWVVTSVLCSKKLTKKGTRRFVPYHFSVFSQNCCVAKERKSFFLNKWILSKISNYLLRYFNIFLL